MNWNHLKLFMLGVQNTDTLVYSSALPDHLTNSFVNSPYVFFHSSMERFANSFRGTLPEWIGNWTDIEVCKQRCKNCLFSCATDRLISLT